MFFFVFMLKFNVFFKRLMDFILIVYFVCVNAAYLRVSSNKYKAESTLSKRNANTKINLFTVYFFFFYLPVNKVYLQKEKKNVLFIKENSSSKLQQQQRQHHKTTKRTANKFLCNIIQFSRGIANKKKIIFISIIKRGKFGFLARTLKISFSVPLAAIIPFWIVYIFFYYFSTTIHYLSTTIVCTQTLHNSTWFTIFFLSNIKTENQEQKKKTKQIFINNRKNKIIFSNSHSSIFINFW